MFQCCFVDLEYGVDVGFECGVELFGGDVVDVFLLGLFVGYVYYQVQVIYVLLCFVYQMLVECFVGEVIWYGMYVDFGGVGQFDDFVGVFLFLWQVV